MHLRCFMGSMLLICFCFLCCVFICLWLFCVLCPMLSVSLDCHSDLFNIYWGLIRTSSFIFTVHWTSYFHHSSLLSTYTCTSNSVVPQGVLTSIFTYVGGIYCTNKTASSSSVIFTNVGGIYCSNKTVSSSSVVVK